jgi:1,4-dihydroxy-2-naphthoyl-CoA hydrolase
MAIWYRPYTVEEAKQTVADTMIDHIGIEITEVGENFLKGTMIIVQFSQ